MKKQSKAEIQKLLDQDFTEPVNSSPEWVSPLVCVLKKNGDVRLCVEMRKANTEIIRNYYPIPTLDEILYEVNGAKIFSKLDLVQGYHQIVLDEKSRGIATFSTPQGLFRYKYLIFGAKNAFEDFEKIVETNITHDINGVFNISDDIIAHATTQNKHLQQLRKVFDKIREKGLKLNLKKCEFGKSSINYMGHILSSEGLFPEPEKVNSILHMKPPSNTSEVRSFLGLVTHCSKFVPNFAAITEPLKRLTRQKVDFIWTGEQESAFSKIKLSFPKLQSCHPAFETKIVADDSKQGLGDALLQKKPSKWLFSTSSFCQSFIIRRRDQILPN